MNAIMENWRNSRKLNTPIHPLIHPLNLKRVNTSLEFCKVSNFTDEASKAGKDDEKVEGLVQQVKKLETELKELKVLFEELKNENRLLETSLILSVE